ncbi:sericin-2-like [Eriocheir sinensis]|uniref:sericin-2-like n=1 Tax=Eriocheir sinensis TaxID=95602 RepID=UPI0021C69CDB|nr:sericin-2-like [Eriocheir sinensis]
MAILQPVQRVRGVLPVKRSRVRRSLAFSGEIGEGNAKNNIQFAEKLSTISVEECAKRWNFDVNKGVPIAGGRFSWSLIDPNTPLDLTPPPVTPGSDAGGQKGQRSEGEDTGVKSSVCVGGDGAGMRSRDEVMEGHSEVKGQEKEEEGMTKGKREERRGEYGGKRRRDEDEEDAVLSSSSSSSSSAAVTASASSTSSSSSTSASSPLRQTSIADYTREKKKRKTNSTTTTTSTTTTPQPPHQSPHKKVLLQIRA